MTTGEDLRPAEYSGGPDGGRIVAIHVRGDSDEFARFPPFMGSRRT